MHVRREATTTGYERGAMPDDKKRRSASEKQGASRKSGRSSAKSSKPASGKRDRVGGSKRSASSDTLPADLMDAEVLQGHDLLGRESVRDGALPGVSGLNDGEVSSFVGQRNNPPLVEDAGVGDGSVTMSGGAAGGERGHAGTSRSGAGGPLGETVGPGEYKATSRFDYDRETVDDERDKP
jgi:hypothetical protein